MRRGLRILLSQLKILDCSITSVSQLKMMLCASEWIHRLEAFKILGRSTFQQQYQSNKHIDELIEVEENLVQIRIKCHPNCGAHHQERRTANCSWEEGSCRKQSIYRRQDHQRRSCLDKWDIPKEHINTRDLLPI